MGWEKLWIHNPYCFATLSSCYIYFHNTVYHKLIKAVGFASILPVPWPPGCYVHPSFQKHLQTNPEIIIWGMVERLEYEKKIILSVHRHPILWLCNLSTMGLKRPPLFRDWNHWYIWSFGTSQLHLGNWGPLGPFGKDDQSTNPRRTTPTKCKANKKGMCHFITQPTFRKITGKPTKKRGYKAYPLEINFNNGLIETQSLKDCKSSSNIQKNTATNGLNSMLGPATDPKKCAWPIRPNLWKCDWIEVPRT